MQNSALFDVYPNILARKSPAQIVAFCSTNRQFRSICTDDFWKKLILTRWGDVLTKGNYQREYQQRYKIDLTKLWTSIYKRDIDMLLSLIDRGIDLNTKDEQGNTPLGLSLRRPELVSILLRNGANPNARTRTWRFLETTPLIVLCSDHSSSFEVLEMLLEAGADPNISDSRGYTPLIAIIYEAIIPTDKRHKIVDKLLEYGADPNKPDQGPTPIVFNSIIGDLYIAQRLLEYGAELDREYEPGETALSIAKQNRYQDLVELLLEYKAEK